jgi:hypothetical protein
MTAIGMEVQPKDAAHDSAVDETVMLNSTPWIPTWTLKFPFDSSMFPSATYNLGPRTLQISTSTSLTLILGGAPSQP